jgi:hypothetical protein
MSRKLNVSPGMLLAFMAVFILGTASAATAGSLINGKKIKKGSIPYSALSKDAKKKLASKAGPQGPAGPAGAAAPTYWAQINQDGGISRSSAGVSSTHSFNSSLWQYRVSFPRDVSSCAYAGSTADPGVIGSNEYTQPNMVSASRSNVGNNVVAVNVWSNGSTQTSIEDSFVLAVYC